MLTRQHANRVRVHHALDLSVKVFINRLAQVDSRDLGDEERVKRCDSEFHGPSPGSGLANKNVGLHAKRPAHGCLPSKIDMRMGCKENSHSDAQWCATRYDARHSGPGFIPLASIIVLASGERRNSRKIFAVSGSFAPDTTKAWMTVGGMTSAGSSPPSATPATGNISLIRVTPSSASPLATASATSDPGPGMSFVRDRSSAPKPRRSATPINVAPSWVPAFGSDSATALAMSIACLTASGVLTSNFGAPARTTTPT